MNPASAIGLLPGTAGGAIGLLLGAPSSGRVRQVALPPAARMLSTLSRLDYTDAFVVETGPSEHLTGEQWARAMLEGAAPDTRRALRWGWAGLGLKLGSTQDDQLVLGWDVRRRSADFALLGADSPLGLMGEVLFKRRRHTLLFATFIQLDSSLMRAVWLGFAPGHRQAVRSLLQQGAGRERSEACW